MERNRLLVATLAVLAVVAVADFVSGAPAVHLVEQQHVTLVFRPLTATAVDPPDDGYRLELGESSPTQLEMRLLWPTADEPSLLRIRADRKLTLDGQMIRLESELSPGPESTPSRAAREIRIGSDVETTTALFEVARSGDHVLTLVVEAELVRHAVYSARPVIGAPVQFLLEIVWVAEGQPVTLETNTLNTFVGQSVSYSFKLGETGEAESARLELLPVQIIGNTVRIEVDVSGTVPDPERGLVVVSREEQWLSTRDAASSVSLASGERETGFRFVVTPRF